MALLREIVSSFTPLEFRGGDTWSGACPFEQHEGGLEVIGERWRCACSKHDAGDDALAFLRAVGEPDPEGALSNGRIWDAKLTVPPRPPSKWGLSRITDDGRKILVTDHRAAAKVADERLSTYCCIAWPDGGDKWALEPLRGREVLLWPTPGREDDMMRLEEVLVRTLGCTGKYVAGIDLAAFTGTGAELIAAAKAANPRALIIPTTPEMPEPVRAGEESPSSNPSPAPLFPYSAPQVPADAATAAGGNGSAGVLLPPPSPVAAEPDSGPVASAEPPPTLPTDWPAGASQERPKRRRLRVAGGTDVDIPEPDAEPIPHQLSESGIAAHFVALHKDKFRTVHEWSGRHGPCWMAWDGSRWKREPNRVSAMQRALTIAHGVKHWDAARAVSDLSKVKFESRKFVGAVLDLASFSPELVAAPQIFDADKMLLNTPGGTVDLTTGKLTEPDITQYLTRSTAITPEPGPHPLFDNVIDRMCAGDDSMRGYIWRALGYSLTADQREEVFWFLHGKPQSGKSTLIKTIAEILGNAEEGGYAATFDMELFTEQRNDKGSERLAHLHGARFAWASETEEGKHFKTALLKLATGGDKISGRFLYQEKFSFEPTHHLWIFGNERIHLKSSDAGIRRRLHMIEYPGVISEEERDNTLKERLKAEYPAILASMIRGCLDWQMCAGLGKPERISDAVDQYMDTEDELSAWLEECTERNAARLPIGDAFRSFTQWAEKNGAYTISAKRFSGEIEKRGFERGKSNGVRYILGLGLKLGANL